MVKLVVGIGNPGRQYVWTRHNIGFLLLDSLASRFLGAFREAPRLYASFAKVEISSEAVVLMKPTTYVNLTGKAVLAAKKFFDVSMEDILVVAETSIGNSVLCVFGKIVALVGTMELRIPRRFCNPIIIATTSWGRKASYPGAEGVADYVLSSFSLNEKEKLNDFLEKGIEEILPWLGC